MSDDDGNEMDYPRSEAGGAIQEDGPTRAGNAFDPTPYMRQLRGRGGNQDYLDVKWRLVWLRREHPDAEILTELVRIEDGLAIFKATVTLPTGGKASGYGSETAADFGDFIEKAETKAIGRALNALGYGAQFSERGEEEPAPPTAPPPPPRPAARPDTPERPAPAAAAPPPAPAEAEPAARPEKPARVAAADAATTAPDEPTARSQPPAPTPIRPASQAPAAQPARPAPQTRPARPAAAKAEAGSDEGDDDVDMADINWTAFWAWARPLGYRNRDEIEALLGRTLATLTPGEVRVLSRAAGQAGDGS